MATLARTQRQAPAPAFQPMAPLAEPAPASRVTELVLPAEDDQSLLLPMLQYLSSRSTQRWLTLISSQPCNWRWLKAAGVESRNLRVINAKTAADALWMAWEMLANGTSHTVIAEPGLLHPQALAELERAAQCGDSRAVLVRRRQWLG